MKQKVFSVFDDKAKAYMLPFFQPEKGMAVRMFSDAVNDPQSLFGKHPEDFTLFFVGEFDLETGEVIAKVPHETMIGGLQVRKVEDE